jgi:RNA polymerase sigma factor (sigma-70 family)
MPLPQDGRWIAQAVDRFEGPLTLYAARLLGGDVERARDVVQDTFLRLWQADHASVDGHIAAWLYRVCRNRAMDVRRKESRMLTTLHHETIAERGPASVAERSRDGASGAANATPVGEFYAESSASTTTPAGASAQPKSVMHAIESLPEKQQEVLRLKFQGELSYAEIASVMEITVNHVGVLIHTAIKALRERLDTRNQNSEAGGGRPAPENRRTGFSSVIPQPRGEVMS